MKKALSIITILCFIIPAISVYIFLLAEKENIKKVNREKTLSENNFNNWIKIELTEEEAQELIEWENDHEFEYKHNMYDVVKKQKSGNHLIYWCYQDLEESFVNEQIGELFSYLTGGHSTRPETRHLLEKIFKKLYCPLQDEISFQLLTLQIQQSGMKITHWQNLTQVIPSPPPDDKLI